MPSIVGDGIRMIRQWRPAAAIVETNGFQSLVAESLIRGLRTAGILTCPVFGVCNTEPKASRIRSLGPYLGGKRLKIRRTKGGKLLYGQLRDFPEGDHDDGPDSLKLAETLADYLLTGNQEGPGRPEVLRA